MRLLLDENLPFSSIEEFEADGHDVIHIRVAHRGMDDEDILAWAHRDERALVTFDSDFNRLIFVERLSHPSVVVFLRREGTGARRAVAIARALLQSTPAPAPGYYVIARNGVRRRDFPELKP